MELYRLTRNGKPALINGSQVITITYDEKARQLEVKFINSEVFALDGDDAASAWAVFDAEVLNGDDTDGSDERPELDADDEDEDEDEERNPLERVGHQLDDLENQLQRGLVTRSWEARLLRDKINDMGGYWDRKRRKQYGEELKRVKERANALADQAEIQAQTNTINKCLTAQIVNTSSVKSILRDLDHAADELQLREQLSDDLKQKIRTAKERLAWHRAKKKLDDSRVAEAGGSRVKGEKYRREAEMMLRQDWTLIFPDEQPPELEALDAGKSV
jgi:hypothetical protein